MISGRKKYAKIANADRNLRQCSKSNSEKQSKSLNLNRYKQPFSFEEVSGTKESEEEYNNTHNYERIIKKLEELKFKHQK